MQVPTADIKKDQVRSLVLNLSHHAQTIWNNSLSLEYIRRYAPDQLEEFWAIWATLDNRLRDYLDDRLPWSDTLEVFEEVAIPVQSSLDSGKPLRYRAMEYQDGPDVMSAARSVFLLVCELTREFVKGGSSCE